MRTDHPAVTVDELLRQAIAFHQAGQLQEAQAQYAAILQSDPNHAVAHHNLGILLVQQNRAADGLPYFVAALQADPAQGQYWLNYIDALFQAGQMDEARQTLMMAREHGLQGAQVEALAERLARREGPGNQEMDELVALFSQGRYEDAAARAEKLTVQFPGHEFGWKALGVAYKELGRTEDALVPMQKAALLSPSDVEAHYNLGVVLQALNRPDEAEASYRKALEIQPDYVDAHMNLGVLLHESKRFEDAERSLRRALEIMPQSEKAIFNLGNVLLKLGKLDEAERIFKSALKLTGSEGEAHFGLGRTLKESGRLDEAEAAYRQSLLFNPDNANVHYNLGNLLKDGEQMDEAESSYRKAINIDPGLALAHYNLGNILKDMDRLEEAEEFCRRAVELKPDHVEAHCSLGMLLSSKGNLEEAEASLRKALQLSPDHADAYCILGIVFLVTKRLEEAEASLRRALQIEPDFVEAHNNLGVVLKEMGCLDAAETSLRRALQIKVDYDEALCNLGGVLIRSGHVHESIQCLRKALEHKPNFALAHSNLIYALDLMDSEDVESLQAERRNWDAAHGAPFYKHWAHANKPNPERKLRIGYVSADIKDHSAAKVFGGMLTRFDRAQFDVFAYSNFKGQDDKSTEFFKQYVTVWRSIVGQSDDAAADMIRNDGIDILVDLSGHSAGNRLQVFARKPAPIQITAWGYASGTGMGAMDVFFSDPVMVPPHEKKYFAEEVRYLPCVVGAFYNETFPDVNELPALGQGIITFGSHNRLTKLSPTACRVWAEVLLGVPDSRLILKSPETQDFSTRERITGHFTRAGVTSERIIMQGGAPWYEHMQAYNQIDIALDPFPHGGGVTTVEGLMMGVPVVTQLWPTMPGRVSASIMTALGLTDWIAGTSEEYVDLAVRKAADLQSLSKLRQQLRGIFTSSIIGDQDAYVRAVEQEYRTLWREWCKKRMSNEDHKV